jgi:regulator of sirC expression with transglutaminase-like and TPR domain
MPSDRRYERDTEFLKLIRRREDVDLTTAALELARDADPRLDFRPALDWIADRGSELAGPIARAKSEWEALDELSGCIAKVHGVFGDADAYDRAESSYLNRVIETRRGIPISLAVLYMAVGRKVGLELHGVSAPMHFLARYESVAGPLFLDAFSRGRILSERECVRWLCEAARLPPARVRSALKPVGPRAIVIRMLNNLKALHARHEDWQAAWTVQHRLAALQPSAYPERRDLALISLRANRPGPAVALLRSGLKVCPRDEAELLRKHLAEARSQLARWN